MERYRSKSASPLLKYAKSTMSLHHISPVPEEPYAPRTAKPTANSLADMPAAAKKRVSMQDLHTLDYTPIMEASPVAATPRVDEAKDKRTQSLDRPETLHSPLGKSPMARSKSSYCAHTAAFFFKDEHFKSTSSISSLVLESIGDHKALLKDSCDTIPRNRQDLKIRTVSLHRLDLKRQELKGSNDSFSRDMKRGEAGKDSTDTIPRSEPRPMTKEPKGSCDTIPRSALEGKTSVGNLNPGYEGILRDLELKGFSGIWNQPLSRMYILMFLIWNGQENLFILRMEVQEYRNTFNKLGTSYRSVAAKRIKKLYLTTNSAFPVEWPADMTNPTIEEVLDRLAITIDTPDSSTFDDIGYLALQSIEKIYQGTFTVRQSEEALQPVSKFLNFRASPFYQAMFNDLHGTTQLTSDQYKRAAERVIELCNTIDMEPGAYENIMVLLEDTALEREFIRQGQKKKQQQTLYFSKSSANLFVEESPISPKSRAPYVESTVNHTFLAAKNLLIAGFCEYCFEASTTDETRSLYCCETCGVKSHKNCRNFIGLGCVKTSLDGERPDGPEHRSERISLIQEKLITLQREVDIELKIQQGLENIVKAKAPKKPNKVSGIGKEILAQLEKNKKRLDVLKHEMQKNQVQLQSLQQQSIPTTSSFVVSGIQENGNSPNYSGRDTDTGILRVVVIDPVTKSEIKKVIFISENQSTVEVIEMILNKSNLNGSPNEYQLSYKLPSTDHSILLKDEDRPTQLENINYADTLFTCQSRTKSKAHMIKDAENPLLKKQQEIMTEIIDSESKYLEDLKLLQSEFFEAIEQSGCLTQAEMDGVFFNILDMINVHEKIATGLNQAVANHKEKVNNLISTFNDAIYNFHCYELYCGNQCYQRAILKRRQLDIPFQKLIRKCEGNPKLHKLSLSDMLMKPLQKITRYPLLFKRLLPSIETDTRQYKDLCILISDLEKSIQEVNENVRKMDARFRIKLIDQSLDFGIFVDKFKIETEDRDLLMENTLQYLSKSGLLVEVIVLVFSDMVLITRRSKKVDGGYILYKPPIPMEMMVLLDQSQLESRKGFQIASQRQEIHTLQSFSVFDKTSWLQGAESARSRYSILHYELEISHMRFQLSKYKFAVPLLQITSPLIRGAFFFSKNKRITDDQVSLTEHSHSISRSSRRERVSSIHKEMTSSISGSGGSKTSTPELSQAEELAGSPKQSPLELPGQQIREGSAVTSPVSTVEVHPFAGTPFTPQDLASGKSRLIDRGDFSQMRSTSYRNLRQSSGNLIRKIKSTFSRTGHEMTVPDMTPDLEQAVEPS